MSLSADNLDSIRIASPFRASWNRMKGDDRVRFCDQCKLNVYNISAMDVEEAAALISRDDERVCIRFYRRKDGTLLTRDCPVGARSQHRRDVAHFGGFAAVWSLLITGIGLLLGMLSRPTATMGTPVFSPADRARFEATLPSVLDSTRTDMPSKSRRGERGSSQP